ncbi:MAG TPA: response regulator [Candidatus Saccharimonadales bacterium]|nr:response regulator [Candidatus Saccharimonadales bacterium]
MTKVLLVEDDNNLREIFEMRLQAEGYQTLTASDGEEALVVALKEKPELIIADIMMPKMSGFEMLETLRAAPDTNNIKVVMMTALGQAEDQARGEKLGVVKYLVKSQVTLEDFVRVVKEVVPPGEGAPKSAATDDKATSNKESEQDMPPADTNPTPTNDTPAPADANPVSDAPANEGQQSTAAAQDALNSQVNDFASAPAAPADPAPAGDDVPVEPVPGPDAPAPTPPTEGPSTPTPPGGM